MPNHTTRFHVALALAASLLFPAALCPAAGKIAGKITNPGRCLGVAAVRRGGSMTRLKVEALPGTLDKKTGKFVIPGLPEGRYDVRVHVEGGHIDGADLKLDESQQSDEPLTEKDRKAILKKIENFPERYSDILRPLYLQGNHKFAKALVEKIRYRPFHSGAKNARNWRVEIWIFEYYYGGWVKKRHGWKVLARIRSPYQMPRDKFDNLLWLFDPKLGGFDVADGKTTTVPVYALPEKLDMSMGKTPGSVEKLAEEHKKKKGAPPAY